MRAKQSDSKEQNGNTGKGTIVLDSGHGGADPGMVGVGGTEEKTLNLIYTKKIAALLEQAGYRVVLTRDSDKGCTMRMNRTKKRRICSADARS